MSLGSFGVYICKERSQVLGNFQGESSEKYQTGLLGRETAYSQDCTFIPVVSVGLDSSGPPGKTDGQHIKSKRWGFDLLPCGERDPQDSPL